MELMKNTPDNHYDLAIVDPPYFDGPNKLGYYRKGRTSSTGVKSSSYAGDLKNWDIPKEEYFKQLARISKHQIVWGINYYQINNLGTGRIVWDKCNEHSTFSDCEIAYCSKINHTIKFTFMWNGMMQGESYISGHKKKGNSKNNEKRIHPTQKPVALYQWILEKYAKNNNKILDTHGGSMSSVIACIDGEFDIDCCELDNEYFAKSIERIQNHAKQLDMFKEPPTIELLEGVGNG